LNIALIILEISRNPELNNHPNHCATPVVTRFILDSVVEILTPWAIENE
jgi:hypothetical protein